jgi:hypothetical protein
MGQARTLDWWMQQLYHCTKEFASNPTPERQQKLVGLISQYADRFRANATHTVGDEHEHLMDYR